jgi:hypothetical protein
MFFTGATFRTFSFIYIIFLSLGFCLQKHITYPLASHATTPTSYKKPIIKALTKSNNSVTDRPNNLI